MHEHFTTLNANKQETNKQLALANANYDVLNARYDAMDGRLRQMYDHGRMMDTNISDLHRVFDRWSVEMSGDEDDDDPEE